jgi:hypothetical protein
MKDQRQWKKVDKISPEAIKKPLNSARFCHNAAPKTLYKSTLRPACRHQSVDIMHHHPLCGVLLCQIDHPDINEFLTSLTAGLTSVPPTSPPHETSS